MLSNQQVELKPKDPWNGIPAQQIADVSLRDFYLAHLGDADCRKIVTKYDEVSLLIWLDAAKKRLMLGMNLPHVSEACAEHVALTPEEARRLGFSEEVVLAAEAGFVR